MPSTPRSKPYGRFGSYVMFKKIDGDSLGELWRAGTLEPPRMGPLMAVRKLGGNREAFASCLPAAKQVAAKASSGTFVKGQRYELVDGEPVIAWEYGSGRSLRHIAEKAREAHNPIPTDQALGIADKIAASLEALANYKQEGKRLAHGAMIPQFVWIYEDGEVRTAGQFLAKGLVTSLADPTIAKELGPYVAPELRSGSEPSRATDVYSIGAILFLAVTGFEPPDSTSGKVLEAVAGAKLPHEDDPLPADIRAILAKALNPDASQRYDGPAEMHQALSELLNKGDYAPTTFNLAFYLHTLLRKEMESEAADRDKESKVNVEPYLDELANPPAPAAPAPATAAPRASQPAPAPAAPAMFGTASVEKQRSKMPMVAGGVVLIAALGVGAYVMFGRKSEPATTVAQTQTAATATAAPAPQVTPVAAPIAATLPGQPAATSTAATTTDDAARKKAIEDEVNRRLQEEMRKLQEQYNQDLKKQQDAAARKPAGSSQPVLGNAAPAVAATTAPPAPATQAPASTAAQPVTPPTATVAEAAPQPVAQAPAAAAAKPVSTGDYVEYTKVDQMPKVTRFVRPTYPPIAARQNVSATTVIVSALVNENGKVVDVKILRGDTRGFGFNEAAERAMREFSFEPAVKDGKKVKTWVPIPFQFGK